MKINIVSDLHVDKGIYTEEFQKSDLLIIAGDICPVNRYEYKELLKKIPRNQRTIITMGNHEYISNTYNFVETIAREIIKDFPHITLLENDVVIVDGIRFLGTTLWSDFKSSGEEHYQANKELVENSWFFPTDNYYDKNKGEIIPVKGIFSETKTKTALEFLVKELSTPFNGKTVVVTHFPPTKRSAETPFIGSKRSAFWVNSYDYLFDYKPDLWIHGHIHESKDYLIENGTRVIANPRGNVQKVVNPDFNPNLILEI